MDQTGHALRAAGGVDISHVSRGRDYAKARKSSENDQ